jgi:hypothetical protein
MRVLGGLGVGVGCVGPTGIRFIALIVARSARALAFVGRFVAAVSLLVRLGIGHRRGAGVAGWRAVAGVGE